MQPGKPLVMASHPRGIVLALPGNPASAMVGFWLFARPALRRMMGFDDAFWHGALAGRLTAPLPPGRDRDRFMPAEVRFQEGELRVAPLAPRGSHDLGAFGRGTGMVRVRAGAAPLAAGQFCEVLPLVDWPSEVSRP
jgi:molybdopterin molybdotransferase